MTESPPTLALLPDFAEESWPSMDLVAEMLDASLAVAHGNELRATTIRPVFQRRFFSSWQRARNADRLLNRFVDYPRQLRPIRDRYDAFHICDHSYAQLVHALPAERVGVFCHDLDTFQCLLDPARDPRPMWFRAMARRILRGLQKASIVFYGTETVRQQIAQHGLLDSTRLIKAPLGVAPEFDLDKSRDAESLKAIRNIPAGNFVLHVGSCIARKRIDVLIDAFALLRQSCAKDTQLTLIQLGGEFTDDQRDRIARAGLSDSIIQVAKQPRGTVAALYRRAKVVLIPSDAEGFGLPVVEALACGAAVVASDIPALRETGGDAIDYVPAGDAAALANAALNRLSNEDNNENLARRIAQAARFSWPEHGRIVGDAYLKLIGDR